MQPKATEESGRYKSQGVGAGTMASVGRALIRVFGWVVTCTLIALCAARIYFPVGRPPRTEMEFVAASFETPNGVPPHVADWSGTIVQAVALGLLAVLSWAVTTGRVRVFQQASHPPKNRT